MSKAFGLVLMMVALYIGMTLHAEGMQHAFGGIFAPIESSRGDSMAATSLSPAAQSADAPSAGEARQPVRVTDAVRNRVTAHMQDGAQRRGY